MRLALLVACLMLSTCHPVAAAERDETLAVLEGLNATHKQDSERARLERFLINKKVKKAKFYSSLICQETSDPFLRRLFAAKLVRESGGEASAVSCKGALGPWQVMPFWARTFHVPVSSLRIPRTNLKIALKVYKSHLEDSQGRVWGHCGAVWHYGGGSDRYVAIVRQLTAAI